MLNISLNKREKTAVLGAAGFIAIFVLVQFIIVPVFEKRNDLRHTLEAKKGILTEMVRLQTEYQGMKSKEEASRRGFESRPAGFTLFSFLDRLAGETGVKDHISYMKPSSAVREGSGLKLSRVEMKIQEINLKDLASYLHRVETSPNMIVVNRLSITKTGPDNGLISAVLQAETVES